MAGNDRDADNMDRAADRIDNKTSGNGGVTWEQALELMQKAYNTLDRTSSPDLLLAELSLAISDICEHNLGGHKWEKKPKDEVFDREWFQCSRCGLGRLPPKGEKQ